MSKFLNDFKLIIRECDYSNTYKMAWAKSLVELSNNYKDNTELVTIPVTEIAKKMFKYYWDQTIYFNLFQSAPNQPPVILQEVKRLIKKYELLVNDFKPIIFDRAKAKIDEALLKDYNKSISKCVTNIKSYVMPFFLNLNRKTYDFYILNKDSITIAPDKLKELNNNQQDLFDLINYRWSLMLENYNSCPRIGKKVRIMDEHDVRRGNLSVFDKFLDLENIDHKCFICGEVIPDSELSRDHVIPWSYMYSDDLWNLVYVHKGCNSTKSNITPSEKEINHLKERNIKLQEALHNEFGDKKIKILQEFDYAIQNDYVDKFYMGCRGC